ncbi:hypothetical protein EV702DRAFT_39241 [Suillus placidus]|uniref:Secreted protein n=1 Tax=Suillus placidus TaxID=48579 RepID=A0A9P7A854_9AGAM|nr:hypothetical protein EV702DRAFT_39241 [Suillus placidus]
MTPSASFEPSKSVRMMVTVLVAVLQLIFLQSPSDFECTECTWATVLSQGVLVASNGRPFFDTTHSQDGRDPRLFQTVAQFCLHRPFPKYYASFNGDSGLC